MISDERERHPAQSLPGSRPTARVRDGELRGDSAVEQHRVLRAERAHDARDLGNGEPKWNAVRAGDGNVQSGQCDEQASLTIESDRKSTRLNSSHGYISYAV